MSRTARLGAFILGSLIVFSIAIFIIGERQFTFSNTYQLQSYFDDVAGLENGAPVRAGGVRIGTIKDIRLPEKSGEKVKVVMDLTSSTHKIIKQNSVASIATEGLLGNKFISISFGTQDSPQVRDGDVIASLPPVDFSDLAKKVSGIADQTQEVMKTVQGVVGSAKGAVDNVGLMTADLKDVSAKINGGEGTIGALINDKQVYQSLNSATEDIRNTMAAARTGVVSFQENMEALKHNFLLRGFFKDRGYFDSTELAKYEIASLPEQPALKKFVIDGKKLFNKENTAKFGKSKLLDPVGSFLEQNPYDLVIIAAYSSEKGDMENNVTLTQARASVVREYLSNNFKLDDSKIKTKGMGEQKSEGATEANRIEISIYSGNLKDASSKAAKGEN